VGGWVGGGGGYPVEPNGVLTLWRPQSVHIRLWHRPFMGLPSTPFSLLPRFSAAFRAGNHFGGSAPAFNSSPATQGGTDPANPFASNAAPSAPANPFAPGGVPFADQQPPVALEKEPWLLHRAGEGAIGNRLEAQNQLLPFLAPMITGMACSTRSKQF